MKLHLWLMVNIRSKKEDGRTFQKMNKSKPKISVIMPVYNAEKFIAGSIDHLHHQTAVGKFETIIIDDGSTDRSVEIAKKKIDENNMKDYVKLVQNGINAGASAARQKGLELAKGDFILFIDADDWMDDTMLECLLNLADAESADIAICNVALEGKRRTVRQEEAVVKGKAACEKCLGISTISGYPYNKLIRHSLISDHKIRWNEKLVYCEDKNFILKCLYHAKHIAYTDQTLYHYNIINTGSVSHRTFCTDTADNLILAVNDIENFLMKKADYYKYANAMHMYKLYIKANILYGLPVNEGIKYRNIFSESSLSYLWKNSSVRFYMKIIFLLYEIHMPVLTTIIKKARNLYVNCRINS